MKREILVHDCGYIVQPGDLLTFEDNLRNRETRPTDIGKQVKFVRIVKGELSTGSSFVYVDGFDEVFYAQRFSCSIMEVDDEA